MFRTIYATVYLNRVISSSLCALALCLSGSGCGVLSDAAASGSAAPAPAVPAAAPPPESAEGGDLAIRFLENRVRLDPDDFIAHNKLGDYYLLRLRETGNVTWLDLATKTARASLRAMPENMNPGGLVLLAQAEFSSHNFAAAREAAERLISQGPGSRSERSFYYQLLADALTELGDYERAESALRQMDKLGSGSIGAAIRLAQRDWLHGDAAGAQRFYTMALERALARVPVPREIVAWCRWQLGELAFATGRYDEADRHYSDALTTFPGYYRAEAGRARALAARNETAAAIELYESVARRIAEPAYLATLGDLYKLAGREKESAMQYALVEQSGRLSAASGELYNRQLALFYADHDLQAEKAFRLAEREYEARQDIFAADTLAWTALKSGRIDTATGAVQKALRLGTKDARLFYHAGMIARAAGDRAAAREWLEKALRLNPHFDPLQSAIARKALEE